MNSILPKLLVIFFIICLIILIYAILEPFFPEVDFWQFHTCDKIRADKFKQLNNSLKIFFFSDLHAGFMPISKKRLKKIVEAAANDVDICLFAGDLANGKKKIPAGLAYLQVISQAMNEQNVPCLAVRGNHDALVTTEDYQKANFKLLMNERYVFSKDNEYGQSFSINLVGLDDLKLGNQNFPSINTVLPTNADLPTLNIVLAHNPDSIYNIPADLTVYALTGHFHGGQIFTPFHLEFKLLRHEQIAKSNIIKGMHKINKIRLFITRGIGCVILPFRFFSRPEFSLLAVPLQESEIQ